MMPSSLTRWNIKPEFLQAHWPVSASVKTLITTRLGGVSNTPYDSFNLGDHVGDAPESVATNRGLLSDFLPKAPYWLNQVHGIEVLKVPDKDALQSSVPSADGSYTAQANQVCCVMTADCLPVLLCNAQGTQVAAVHAGWRGLLDGILEEAIKKFDENDTLLAYLGPAIGPSAFEVGAEVRDAFMAEQSGASQAFVPSKDSGKWLADLYALAKIRLNLAGVQDVFGGDHCTFSEPQRFFSYRRDGQTGRMASCIWIEADT